MRNPEFYFSVVRVVPDPIKDEAINVGVVVGSDDGRALMKVAVPRTRIRSFQRRYPFSTLEKSISDLAFSLGIDLQPALGEIGSGPADRSRLQAFASSLNNQIQLTAPKLYLAENLDDALAKLFRRYVARRSPATAESKPLTHAILKERIWKVVQDWRRPNVDVEQGGFIRGLTANHPVDIVVRNGHPRAAMSALPIHPDDRNFAYLYRDSLPTIAADMGPAFRVYAVLPTPGPGADPSERDFAEETRIMLAKAKDEGVRTVQLENLDSVRQEVTELLI